MIARVGPVRVKPRNGPEHKAIGLLTHNSLTLAASELNWRRHGARLTPIKAAERYVLITRSYCTVVKVNDVMVTPGPASSSASARPGPLEAPVRAMFRYGIWAA